MIKKGIFCEVHSWRQTAHNIRVYFHHLVMRFAVICRSSLSNTVNLFVSEGDRDLARDTPAQIRCILQGKGQYAWLVLHAEDSTEGKQRPSIDQE